MNKFHRNAKCSNWMSAEIKCRSNISCRNYMEKSMNKIEFGVRNGQASLFHLLDFPGTDCDSFGSEMDCPHNRKLVDEGCQRWGRRQVLTFRICGFNNNVDMKSCEQEHTHCNKKCSSQVDSAGGDGGVAHCQNHPCSRWSSEYLTGRYMLRCLH